MTAQAVSVFLASGKGGQYVAQICCPNSSGELLDGVFSVFPTEFSNA